MKKWKRGVLFYKGGGLNTGGGLNSGGVQKSKAKVESSKEVIESVIYEEKGNLNPSFEERPSKKKGRKPKLSEDQKNRLVNLYLEGYPTRELSYLFNISEMTVYRVINEHMKRNFSGGSIEEVYEKVKRVVWNKA